MANQKQGLSQLQFKVSVTEPSDAVNGGMAKQTEGSRLGLSSPSALCGRLVETRGTKPFSIHIIHFRWFRCSCSCLYASKKNVANLKLGQN